jgi:hypothetical protein
MMRGTGARDCFTGSALLYLAVRGGDYRPWLAMRAVADAADGLAGRQLDIVVVNATGPA